MRGREPVMVHYSVLVPVRDANSAVTRLLAQLGEVLDRLILPYEILCILDASVTPSTGEWDQWMNEQARLRVLRFDQPRGISAALRAGIAAARGELILGVSPHSRIAVDRVAHLISRLGRYDFAFAVPERTIGQSLRNGLAGVPRLLAGSHDRLAAKELFFAARRESLTGLALAGGALRVLPELVVRRGFRVCRVGIAEGLPPRGARLRPGLLKRLAANWHARRFEPYLAREQARDDYVEPSPILARAGLHQRRPARPSPALPAHHKHGKIV